LLSDIEFVLEDEFQKLGVTQAIGGGFQYHLLLLHEFAVQERVVIGLKNANDYPPSHRAVVYIETQGKSATLKTVLEPAASY
jgi:hypothetical protein